MKRTSFFMRLNIISILLFYIGSCACQQAATKAYAVASALLPLPFVVAFHAHDVATVKEMLAAHPHYIHGLIDNQSLLTMALIKRKPNKELINLLLDYKADPNQDNPKSAIHPEPPLLVLLKRFGQLSAGYWGTPSDKALRRKRRKLDKLKQILELFGEKKVIDVNKKYSGKEPVRHAICWKAICTPYKGSSFISILLNDDATEVTKADAFLTTVHNNDASTFQDILPLLTEPFFLMQDRYNSLEYVQTVRPDLFRFIESEITNRQKEASDRCNSAAKGPIKLPLLDIAADNKDDIVHVQELQTPKDDGQKVQIIKRPFGLKYVADLMCELEALHYQLKDFNGLNVSTIPRCFNYKNLIPKRHKLPIFAILHQIREHAESVQAVLQATTPEFKEQLHDYASKLYTVLHTSLEKMSEHIYKKDRRYVKPYIYVSSVLVDRLFNELNDLGLWPTRSNLSHKRTELAQL